MPQPLSAAATRLIPPNLDYPLLPILACTAPLPFALFLSYVDHQEGYSDAMYAKRPGRSAFLKRRSGDLERTRFSSLFNIQEQMPWTKFRRVFFSVEEGG